MLLWDSQNESYRDEDNDHRQSSFLSLHRASAPHHSSTTPTATRCSLGASGVYDEITNISQVSSVVVEPLPSSTGHPSPSSPSVSMHHHDEEDDEEILTPFPEYSAAEKADALWRVQLRDPVMSKLTPLKDGAISYGGAPQRTESPGGMVTPAAERLFADAVARSSARHASYVLAKMAKEQEELARCTFTPKTNTTAAAVGNRSVAPNGGDTQKKISRGEALYQHHATQLARLAAATKQKQSDIERAASPFVSHYASSQRRHVAHDTHQWERKRQERLMTMRIAKEASDKAACSGTPNICEHSRTLDHDLHARRNTNYSTMPTYRVHHDIDDDDDGVLSCVSGSTTFCTPCATPPRQWPDAMAALKTDTTTPIVSSTPAVVADVGSSPQQQQRFLSLYHQGVVQQQERAAAIRRADSVAVALSDVRRHIAVASTSPRTRHNAVGSSPSTMWSSSPPRSIGINMSQPILVHQRLYQDSETSRLREQWSAACSSNRPREGHSANQRTISPIRKKKELHHGYSDISISTTTPKSTAVPIAVSSAYPSEGDNEVIVVYEL